MTESNAFADECTMKVEHLKALINENRELRDAQSSSDSYLFQRFQDEITELTERMFAWQDATPRLVAIHKEMCAASRAAARAQRDADRHMDTVWMLTKVLGIPGIVALFVVLLFNPSVWLNVVMVLLLVGAAGTIVYGTRTRGDWYEAVDAADRRVAELEWQLHTATPGNQPTPVPAPWQKARPGKTAGLAPWAKRIELPEVIEADPADELPVAELEGAEAD